MTERLNRDIDSLALELDIKPGKNYEVWKTPRLSPEEFIKLDSRKQLTYLATLAHLAPSTHNTQPWAFKIKPDFYSLDIFLDRGEYYKKNRETIDKRRVLPFSDVKGRQACISIGCSIANLAVGAEYFGFKPKINLTDFNPELVKPLTDPKDAKSLKYIPVANIELLSSPDNVESDQELFKSIFTRKVNRGEYKPYAPIEDKLLDTTKEIAKENNTSLHLITRKSPFDFRRELIAEAQFQAENFVVNDERFRGELSGWFLTNDTDEFLGMPGDTFGLDDKTTKNIKDKLSGDKGLKIEDLTGLPYMTKAGIDSAYAIGLITTSEDIPIYWVKAGITLEKVFLLFEKNQISLAIHAGLAEVKLSRLGLSLAAFTSENPSILFRAGYPKEKKPHSPRLPIEEVSLKE